MHRFLFLSLSLSFFDQKLFASEVFNQKYDSVFSKAEESVISHSPSKESALCMRSLPQNTRYFLYRRYVDQAMKSRSSYSSGETLVRKYGLMSYLACRESGGMGVALSAHGSEAKVSYYGSLYSAMKKGIREMIAKRFKCKKKSYFSSSTNVGLFQVSSDQVDNVPDKYDPDLEIHRYFIDRVQSLAKMNDKSIVLSCGTEEFFNLQKEPEILKELKDVSKWMKNYIFSKQLEGGQWFNEDQGASSSEVEALSQYVKLQTLCPSLNFELAKRIHDLKGAHYFGPLSNKRNSRSCGTSFSVCAPVFRAIDTFLF